MILLSQQKNLPKKSPEMRKVIQKRNPKVPPAMQNSPQQFSRKAALQKYPTTNKNRNEFETPMDYHMALTVKRTSCPSLQAWRGFFFCSTARLLGFLNFYLILQFHSNKTCMFFDILAAPSMYYLIRWIIASVLAAIFWKKFCVNISFTRKFFGKSTRWPRIPRSAGSITLFFFMLFLAALYASTVGA